MTLGPIDYVADTSNHRVVVYDVASITNGENAVLVLGQANFTSGVASLSATGLSGPSGVAIDTAGDRLFVSDTGNIRVLVYTLSTLSDGIAAANVLGQPDFATTNMGATLLTFSMPQGIAVDPANDRLYVTDMSSHRVLVFDISGSVTDNMPPVNVLGQLDFTSSLPAATAIGMTSPTDVALNALGTTLFANQFGASRVTVYDVSTITDGETAINVLGNSSLVGATFETTQVGLDSPFAIAYDDTSTRLAVVDTSNNRLSFFDVAVITDGENAVDGLGQSDGGSITDPVPDYTKSAVNDTPNRLGFSSPYDAEVDTVGHRLFVSDSGNNRVLVYNLTAGDSLIDRVPDFVLGQPNFATSSSDTTATSMNTPTLLAVDSAGQRLFVSDFSNSRVLVFDIASIANGEPASNVLGQPDFVTSTDNTTATGLNSPEGLAYNSGKLYVADVINNRVLLYDVSAITDGEAAVNVLGQADFTSAVPSTLQTSTKGPRGLAIDSTGNRLFVSEQSNNRVTVFDISAIADNEPAINVLGQAIFTTATAGNTSTEMSAPRDLAYDSASQTLFVAQQSNQRVQIYDAAAITDGEAAINILGQTSFAGIGAPFTAVGLSSPCGVGFDLVNDRLYVGQTGFHRVSIFDNTILATTSTSSSSSSNGGGGRSKRYSYEYVGTSESGATTSVVSTTSPSLSAVLDSNLLEPDSNLGLDDCKPGFPARATYNARNNPAKVREMQRFLNKTQGEDLLITGLYHLETFNAVKRFEQAYGLEVLGIWGAAEHNVASNIACGFKIPVKASSTTITTSTSISPQQDSYASCAAPFISRQGRGEKNNPTEVTRLQHFLEAEVGATFPVYGFFGPITEYAVKTFQVKYAHTILTPQNYKNPTGIWGPFSLKQANQILCEE